MAKKTKHTESLFLNKVSLSGYKSISEVDIEFQKGLNIIIGKNAAGKTNFLTFLSSVLSLDYIELSNFSASLHFQNGKPISLIAQRNIDIKEVFHNNSSSSHVKTILKISGKEIKDKKDKETSIYEKLRDKHIAFESTFLCHGIPLNYLIVDKPFSFKIEKKTLSSEILKIIRDYRTPYFLKCVAIDIIFATFYFEDFDIDSIKEKYDFVFERIELLKNALNAYSPIQDLRFSDNYNIFIEEDKESYLVNNLFLEFKIDGSWLPFSSLSDGTKRLFYIISELSEYQSLNVRPSNGYSYYRQSEISRIVLIEEPELGIHPHQFHKLMEFLKEQSLQKQIIITTHSPQALDSLNEDEFNRIIIAFSLNSKEGTKLRHLTEQELVKARAYIKEDFLSDYWLYSDLEK
jgi:predicted ATP-binding protein involved in virulence